MIQSVPRAVGMWWRGIDRTLLFVILALIATGLVLSMAASPAAAERLGIDEPFYFFFRQSVFAGLSVIVLLAISALSPKGARRLAAVAMIGAFVLLILTLLVGYEVKGATRWLRVGPFSLQPSEFLKPAFLVTAAWLFSEEKRGAPVPGQLIAFGLYLVAVGLLMMQPDFGQTVLLTLCFGGIFFASGLSWLWVAVLGSLAASGSTLAYFTFPHIASRVDRFLNPESGDTYQIDRATEAISRGGIAGVGPGEGEVKHLLPDAYTDFIFSVAAEEFGLIASLAIIGLFAILVTRAWMQVMRLQDGFAQLAVAGLALQFGLQSLVNIAVNLNLIPPKGMTLPFVSYGGSSMLALAFGAGLLLAFTRRRPGAYTPRYAA
ncbi:putative lipid II flippase FtsW [Maricaulis maris]|jgi:cell division protein FtsW|uniref:putative lipid II flippase FtsW n=1 Tax=Maricaulis maris TaxID=74318 RepID=UPI00291E916C|nr:putative lipid II flippase FtsW [Maricaulis maris]